MNDIINKLLLARDKCMPGKLLKQPRFTYSVCGPFTRNKERTQKFKEMGDSRYIYRNYKACFQHDMAYGNFKDLGKITAGDKFLRDKTFNIAKDPKHDGYQPGLAAMVYKIFERNTAGSGFTTLLHLCLKMSN